MLVTKHYGRKHLAVVRLGEPGYRAGIPSDYHFKPGAVALVLLLRHTARLDMLSSGVANPPRVGS